MNRFHFLQKQRKQILHYKLANAKVWLRHPGSQWMAKWAIPKATEVLYAPKLNFEAVCWNENCTLSKASFATVWAYYNTPTKKMEFHIWLVMGPLYIDQLTCSWPQNSKFTTLAFKNIWHTTTGILQENLTHHHWNTFSHRIKFLWVGVQSQKSWKFVPYKFWCAFSCLRLG